MTRESADVIVIGGGVIGSAIAFFLADSKVDVILLEKGGIAAGSSGACDGAVAMQTKRPGLHLELALESRALLGRIQERLPIPIEYDEVGGLIVAETEDEMSALQQVALGQRRAGLDVALLDQKQLRDVAPPLSHRLTGAAYSQEGGKVNPIALTLGFALGARNLGARVRTGTAVLDILVDKGRISGVATSGGRIDAPIVVNAAGVYAPVIGRMLGLEIPITPRRGQLLVTEARGPLLEPWLGTASYISAKYNSRSAGEGTIAGGVSIDQTRSGTFLLGSTREFVGYDKSNTVEGLQQVAAHAVSILPDLEHTRLIRAFAGLRPHTPDGLPILGKVDKVGGFLVAAGHEGDGIALSAVTGKLIRDLILGPEPHAGLASIGLGRFSTEIRRFRS